MSMNETRFKRLWSTKTKNDEWWSSFVTSPLAIAVNLIVVDYKWLTPNRVTLLSFFTAIVAAVFIVISGPMNFIIAAALIQISHILDCVDGQMARYRGTTTGLGSYLDKLTDQIKVILWFGVVGYVTYDQTQNVLPVFLAFIGVSFYSLRGYVKYVVMYTEMLKDKDYLDVMGKDISDAEMATQGNAGLGCGVLANVRWFIFEQRKIIFFNEGVFIFMLSLALILNMLMEMLWIFAISQVIFGIGRGIQRGRQLCLKKRYQILSVSEK